MEKKRTKTKMYVGKCGKYNVCIFLSYELMPLLQKNSNAKMTSANVLFTFLTHLLIKLRHERWIDGVFNAHKNFKLLQMVDNVSSCSVLVRKRKAYNNLFR